MSVTLATCGEWFKLQYYYPQSEGCVLYFKYRSANISWNHLLKLKKVKIGIWYVAFVKFVDIEGIIFINRESIRNLVVGSRNRLSV